MKPVKIGVFGARRGLNFARSASDGMTPGLELSCICDFSTEKLEKAAKDFNVDLYDDFDKMLGSGIDAVVLANYFHEHAPYAIRAMRAGKHVMSETMPAATMAEAVLLCEAVEETGMTYMFAENYPFTKIGIALKKEFDSGIIGRALYGEGEYIHPIEASEFNKISPGGNHWRNWIPSTYYSTHALAPLMYFTGAKPVRVSAFSVAEPSLAAGTPRRNDPLAILMCTMDDGSLFRTTGWINAGGHSSWCRLLGTRGTLEAPRQYDGGYFGNGMLHIMLNELEPQDGRPFFSSYRPEWPADSRDAEKTGHGGADYFMNKMFLEAITSGKSPEYFDVYDGAAMSAVAILGWKSALANGAPYDIPDFRDKSSRNKYRDDFATPFPNDKGW
ncbi:MAG: Gfo/Idh/MocA family oxidoreductase, partial [Clostridia bacterium]|nr:Gfo/Idh/MocA family oxidoreductase [Clostridia bacterium]